MRDLYLGAVHDLDRGFGVFLGMLERRGLGSAFLLFTSDHGEAFGEHDNLMHGTGVWDELTRVPLLVRGPGLEPRRVPWSATLVDVARTLADMAGVEPAPDWRGASLLRLEEDRPAFLFDCALGGRNHRAAVVDGPRKLLIADEDEAIAEGRALGLYDLSDDPAERENRLGPSTWTDEDRAWLRRALAAVRRPVVEAATATLDADAAEAMGALGYAGDD
jgi:arylsulfatase A-like enzyme